MTWKTVFNIVKTLVIVVVVPGGCALIAYHGVKEGKKVYDKWKAGKKDPDSDNKVQPE